MFLGIHISEFVPDVDGVQTQESPSSIKCKLSARAQSKQLPVADAIWTFWHCWILNSANEQIHPDQERCTMFRMVLRE